MKKNILLLLLFCSAHAAHFESLVDLTIKVEDANFNLRVKSVTFNEEAIELDDNLILKPRASPHFRLPPGRYILLWVTEKTLARRAKEPLTQDHERILVLERDDNTVRINIKGDDISLY